MAVHLKSDFKAPQNDSTDLFHYFLDLKVHFIKDFKIRTHTRTRTGGEKKQSHAPRYPLLVISRDLRKLMTRYLNVDGKLSISLKKTSTSP